MASSQRLQRLRNLVQPALAALPDRPMDDDESGGVSLQETDMLASKQSTANETETDPSIKELHASNSIERRFFWVRDTASSFSPNLDSMRISTDSMHISTAPPSAAELPVTDLQRGDLASAKHHYTPIHALAKYPYKYCNKSLMQDIAYAFFDQGKFWNREWDLYYVWDIEPSKPLVLVRETQVQALLKDINSHLNLSLRITDQQREEGLVARFPDHPRCLPRYLGRSHSRDDMENMAANAPSHTFRAAGEATHPPLQPPTLEEFKQLMEDMADAQKAKGKASKAKKQQDRLAKTKSMADQFKRTQRYLALRPSIHDSEVPPSPGPPAAIDPSIPAPFTFDQSVVFVCVDVESYEKDHHKITEVGVATLDTRDLIGVAPGKDGEAWREQIRARHFRINEYRHLVNHEFVTGHPNGFLFGESEFVPLGEASDHVATCFHAPFGARNTNSEEDEMGRHVPTEKRNIVLLGHDTLGDIRYLQNLGYDVMKVENILESLDTATMYKLWHRDQQPTSLGKILLAFDIVGWKLHNAGNDAVYTVQAMLAICVREATIRGSPELDKWREKVKETREQAAVAEAKQKVMDEAREWSDHEADGDGGVPVPLSALEPPKSKAIPQIDDAGAGRGRASIRGRSEGQRGRSRGLPDLAAKSAALVVKSMDPEGKFYW